MLVHVQLLVMFNVYSLASAQFDNYNNWPETPPPVVKTEVHSAGKETRIRCHIKERFRHIQNGLNLTWEYKSCRAGHSAPCLGAGDWRKLCGAPRKPCPPILALVEPRAQDSGLYRCHITLDASIITLNLYLLEFIEKRREPPVIVDGMASNLTVAASLVAVLQCKVRSPVPPTVRWFRRLERPHYPVRNQSQNFVQYLNNTYQMLNCCAVAALSQRNLYLSKLVISSSTVYDSGFYICLAINDANYTYKEAYINVLPLLRHVGEKAEKRSFWVLFLIPAALALIPVMAWMMCIRPRKLTKMESVVPPPQTPAVTRPMVHTHGIPLDSSYLPVRVTPSAPN